MPDDRSDPRPAGPIPPRTRERLRSAGVDLGGLDRLGRIHRELWQVEDQSRSRQADLVTVGQLKRRVHELNAQRHAQITALDRGAVWVTPAGGRLYSETPGELCDRLEIIGLKLAGLDDAAVSGDLAPAAVAEADRHRSGLAAWRDHLVRCLDELLADLCAGRAVLPPRAEIKLYDDERFNPVLRAEAQSSSSRS
jgi:hypothetical protein